MVEMERSLFGELAVEAGYLTSDALRKAEELQAADEREGGVPRPLGIICLQEGLMTYRHMVATLERAERKAGRVPAARKLMPRRKGSLLGQTRAKRSLVSTS
jgi:hypothetical protein